MMRKIVQMILIVSTIFVFSGCGFFDSEQLNGNAEEVCEETVKEESKESAEMKETQEEAEKEKAKEEDTKGKEAKEHYEHSEEGYFSLLDEGAVTQVKAQIEGTCWVYAASSAMESSYKYLYGKDIEVDPFKIVDAVYVDDKDEGYFLADKTDPYNIGGWNWQVVERTANGVEDYILVDAHNYEFATVDELKEGIKKYGAMSVDINDGHVSLFRVIDGYKTFHDSETEDFDHAVIIIGWDDHFPKEYYVKTASQDGAWLAQNSRGRKWGNNGCCWISYDTPLGKATSYNISYDYDRVVAYDAGNEKYIEADGEIKLANVFHDAGMLRAVGTYIAKPNQKIFVEIYNETMTDVLYSQEETFETSGYHLVKLDESISVKDYAIAVTYEKLAPVEGDAWCDDDGLIEYRVSSEAGKSFVFMNGEWLDLYDSRTADLLGIDFVPNNCCIKAVY